MDGRVSHGRGGPPTMGNGGRGSCCGSRHGRGGAGRGALAEPAVIAALMSGGAHGYDLRRAIAEITSDQIDVDQGGLYRVLRRLEAEGYVVSVWVEGDSGPQRREYELTSEAEDLAHDWVSHLREREQVAGLLAGLLEAELAGRTKDTEADPDSGASEGTN